MDEVRCGQQRLLAKASEREEREKERGGVVNISSDTAAEGQGRVGEGREGLGDGWCVYIFIYVCVCVCLMDRRGGEVH